MAETTTLTHASTSETWSASPFVSRSSAQSAEVRGGPVAVADEVQSWLAHQSVDIKPRGPRQSTSSAATRTVEGNNSDNSSNTSRVVGLKKWAGQVQSVHNEVLTVHLHPVDHDGPSLSADFDIALLAPDEAAVRQGAVVYLTTRMVQSQSGRIEAMTQLRLRRLRRWSKEELEEIMRLSRARARKFANHANRTPRG